MDYPFEIYNEHFNIVFILSIAVSIFLVIVTCWYTNKQRKSAETSNKQVEDAVNGKKEMKEKTSEENDSIKDDLEILNFEESIPGKVKRARQKATEHKILDAMSEEDKLKEAEVKKKQLAAIFELMKQNEDKFGSASSDDLQQQMHLYT